ncbi:MAG: Transposase [Candidatus Woesebacteria bacterium GW2011_GWC1_43_10b]|uniref:Transposase n=1 Tax=Candidatus Woesebacteria bacterium GW2011_GWC1_43_10b TaxID=1618585 RepID=A0A0G1C5D8_9BACT|nr:MAG: Transposase [Candidatus Woesebacteria bacterium GW2011_GWC1_43_10b]KKT22084.1 MAG: Transposase [Parcubacteria group bacterium GW2011_GWB1_43_8b]
MLLAGSLLTSIVLSMSAPSLHKTTTNGAYRHIYNKGIENGNIYRDKEDYETFISYLKQYLSEPDDPKNIKKVFTVNGRSFQGIPHQPKNYFNKIELIAYSLMPNHFHLILDEMTKNSLEGFIRSLCTRYSMYFNKKYHRTGSLFVGPYKSAQIKDISHLPPLTHHIHHGLNDFSSYPEYSGKRKTSWVNTNVVLSLKNKDNYENVKFPDGITFEDNTQQLERSILEPGENKSFKEVYSEPVSKSRSKAPTFIATATLSFVLLFSLGIRNIKTSIAQTKNSANSVTPPTSQVSGAEDEISEPEAEPEAKIMLVIKISDESESVNIRKEPSTKSDIVIKAKEGDAFEYVSKDGQWYKIKLDDNTFAFVSERYAIVEGEE